MDHSSATYNYGVIKKFKFAAAGFKFYRVINCTKDFFFPPLKTQHRAEITWDKFIYFTSKLTQNLFLNEG